MMQIAVVGLIRLVAFVMVGVAIAQVYGAWMGTAVGLSVWLLAPQQVVK